MPHEVIRIACDVCDADFKTDEEARACEAKGRPEVPDLQVGDRIRLKRDACRHVRVVKAILVEPRTHRVRYYYEIGSRRTQAGYWAYREDIEKLQDKGLGHGA